MPASLSSSGLVAKAPGLGPGDRGFESLLLDMAYDPEYQRAWYARNRDKHLANVKKRNSRRKAEIEERLRNLKSNTPCMDCKEQYPFYVMQFDHVRGVKSINLSQVSSNQWSDDRLQEEIDKCEIVCANCHAQRTYERSHDGC